MVDKKVDKEAVDYSKGMPERRCSLCKYFRKPRSCALVAGDIAPDYWCQLYTKGKGNGQASPR